MYTHDQRNYMSRSEERRIRAMAEDDPELRAQIEEGRRRMKEEEREVAHDVAPHQTPQR